MHAYLLPHSCLKNCRWLPWAVTLSDMSIVSGIWWSNDKTIVLSYALSSDIVVASVSQINYWPQPLASENNWYVRHRQITIFSSTSAKNCWMVHCSPKFTEGQPAWICKMFQTLKDEIRRNIQKVFRRQIQAAPFPPPPPSSRWRDSRTSGVWQQSRNFSLKKFESIETPH